MKNSVSLLALIFILFPTMVFSDPGIIKTIGNGESSIYPDRVELHFELYSEGKTPISAVEGTAKKHNAILGKLLGLGFSEEDIFTKKFFVAPINKKNLETREWEASGYKAIHIIKVELIDLSKIGTVIDNVIGAGATKIIKISFGSSKLEEVHDTALKSAVIRAKQKARIMAETTGGELGDLIEMNTERRGTIQAMGDDSTGEARSIPTTIVPDKISVRVRVETMWEYRP